MLPNICTYNIRGVPRTNTIRNIQRKTQLRKNLRHLTHTYQILLLQETHLQPSTKHHIHTLLPKSWKTFQSYAKESDSWSGTAISFSPYIDNHYTPRTYRTPRFNGRIQILDLLPKEEDHLNSHPPLRIGNVYLPSGSQGTIQAEQLIQTFTTYLATLPPLPLLLGGDFNNIIDISDTSAPKTHLLHQSSSAWKRATKLLLLTELHQPNHTCFNSKQTSSRVDRLYTSLTQAELHWANPCTLLSPTPHTPLHKGNTTPPTDHFPVGVVFQSKRKSNTSPTIPHWLPTHPSFQAAFPTHWANANAFPAPSPWIALQRLKKAAHSAAKETRRNMKQDKVEYNDHVRNYTDILRYAKQFAKEKSRPPASIQHLFHKTTITPQDIDKALLTTAANISKPTNPPPQEPTSINQHHRAPTGTLHTQSLEALTSLIPTARLRLPGLKTHPNDSLSTNPATMTRIASKYWGKIWKRQPADADAIQDYLGRHAKKVHTPLHPPTLDNIQEEIAKPRCSAPGPDGIPFSVYRSLADIAGPILYDVANRLSEDESGAPPDFNSALLYLLPKGQTYTPEDTRPISITNTDNRLIAAAIARKLGTVLNESLHPAQQGFITTRNYDSHIHTLTHRFYTAEHNNTQHHILFMDTAKAFDTIHHTYLHQTLQSMHFPTWFRNTITHLTHNITAQLSFANRHARPIPIERGVKQGCPLSPLLFAICFDPLLRHLSSIREMQAFAVADDLAVSTSTLQRLPQAMRRIDSFKQASGLGHNVRKTALLSTSFSNPSQIQKWLKRSPWPGMSTTREYKYLGIQIGNDATLESIYRAATAKATRRLLQLRPILQKAQTHQKLFIVNTYVMPILTYIARFYIPDPTQPALKRFLRVIAQHTIRFQGKAYKNLHLYSSIDRAGPTPGITHPYHTAIAQLATGAPAYERIGVQHSHLKEGPSRSSIHHTEKALRQIAKRLGRSTVPEISGTPTTTRRQYRKLLQSSLHAEQNKDLHLLYQRRELPNTPDTRAQLHRLFHLTHNPIHRNHHFDLLTNAIATSRRYRHALGRERSEVPKCYLCNEQEDSADHLYGQCPVVTEGKRLFWAEQGLTTPDPSRAHYYNPVLPADKKTATHLAQTTTTFNYAVWVVRCRHERQSGARVLPNELCREATNSWKINHAQGGAFGSATNRTQDQRKNALDYARRLTGKVDNNGIVAFTDGAAKGNPGPCGAGCHIRWNADTSSNYSISLGTNSNNFGEWWGAGMALQATLNRLQHNLILSDTSSLHIFTDSNLLCQFISKGFLPHKATLIQQQLYTLFRSLQQHLPVYFHWIPGHSGLPGNEKADQLATQGALESQLHPPHKELIQQASSQSNFLPDLLLI